MRDFLEAIMPMLETDLGGYIEIREIDVDGKVRQHFLSSYAAAENQAYMDSVSDDVYFGVLPRLTQHGGGSSIDDFTHILWGDYDPKILNKPGLFAAITGLSPKPQIVVDSGSGYHVYWLLDRSYPFIEAQTVMRDIAGATGGDNVHDKARILRLPGTLNHKTMPPKPVRLLRLDTLAPLHRLSDFYQYADQGVDLSYAPTFEDLYGPQRPIDLTTKPFWLVKLIGEDPGHGQRSEHVFHVVAAMVELGYSDEVIEQVMVENPHGVGAKYHEKEAQGGPRAAHRWLQYPIAEARRRHSGNG